MLKQQNPRTVTKLKVDDDNRFEICFMAFNVCIFDFRECCRPAITIDENHIKGKYNEILFIAKIGRASCRERV